MIRNESHFTRIPFAPLNAEFDDRYLTKRIHFTLSMLRTRYLVQKCQFLWCGFIFCARRSFKKYVLPSLNIKSLLQYKLHFIFFSSITLPPHSGPRPLIQFCNHFSQAVGLFGRVISPSKGLYLNTGQHKHRINAYTPEISRPWMGFEPTIPACERAKTVHALDRADTVTGKYTLSWKYIKRFINKFKCRKG
jgi:hypothetical protein